MPNRIFGVRALALCFSVLISPTAIADPAPQIGVGSQYDTTHVYVDPKDFDAFVKSFLATFGGVSTKPVVADVTPTPSSTISQVVRTPVGALSVFGFKTPIPYPFGTERTGYLVTDIDEALKAARSAGAGVVVSPFSDAIGRDAVIQWPGGVNMQLYWHTTKSSSPALQTVLKIASISRPIASLNSSTASLHFRTGKLFLTIRKRPESRSGDPAPPTGGSGSNRFLASLSPLSRMAIFPIHTAAN